MVNSIAAIAALVVLTSCIVLLSNAHQHGAGRMLILGGESVPTGSKTYVARQRNAEDSVNFCGGTLISPTHVLTASHCTSLNPRWVSVGGHNRNGTRGGERIKVMSMTNHPNYSENIPNSDDFMVLELERPIIFNPLQLAAADVSDFKAGQMATAIGWGTNAEANGTGAFELQRVDVPMESDEACAGFATTDSSMVCAGGVFNHDSCGGDSGGPLIAKSVTGEDVLIGVISWGKDDTCGGEGYYGIYSRVSSGRPWMDSITGDSGTCLR